MTVLIPEVAAGGAEAGAAAEGAAEGYGGTRARRKAAEKARGAVQGAPGYYAGQSRELSGGRLTPGSRNYQPAILAEFLVAVLIVTLTPLATGGGEPTTPTDTPGKSGGVARPSPYHVNDLIQLVAIGGIYFVLALLSSGERTGRIAAWFGGLILIGLLIGKMKKGQVTAALDVLSAPAPPPPPASGGPPPGTQLV